MKQFPRGIREIAIAIGCSVGIMSHLCSPATQGRSPRKAATPAETLRRYVQLRMEDANWKLYSKLITWPDEPSWDCKWVTADYQIGTARTLGQKAEIPVTYKRLGLFISAGAKIDRITPRKGRDAAEEK
jgi:hypothetical protein